MIIVADSSALIALATCDGLDVLLRVYDDVRVPQAVYIEVAEPEKPQAAALLIDDHRARVIAEHNQINCIGTLGVLLFAKQVGKIDKIAPYIQKLRPSSIRYGEALLNKVLKLAGE
ncbi:MAG: DUF3368 domain-containing protein [Anaerolineales bacterium]